MAPDTAKETDAMNTTPLRTRRRKGILAAGAVTVALLLSGCAGSADLVSYDLPAKSARYTFEAETDGTKTVWQYTSARVTKADVPKETPCMGEVVSTSTAPCRPEPLIFLRYDFGLALDNTAEAGKTHEITVTGYYQERLTATPEVTSVKVEASFDGGREWRPVTTRSGGANTFTARVDHPKPGKAGRVVSLRVSATDDEGNTVKQTLPTAYTLR